MGFVKFEQFFRAAGGVSVDRDDVKRHLDFVNDALYDLLLMGHAAAKANARGIIEPWDLPITGGCRRASTRTSASTKRSSSGPSSRTWRPGRRSTPRLARRPRTSFR